MSFAPPETLERGPLTLRRYVLEDAPALKESIAASLESLRPWMPWAQQPPTDESIAAFLVPAAESFGGDSEAAYAITLTDGGRFVGAGRLIPRVGPGALEIGYWVDVRHLRQGIATTAAGALSDAALALDGIGRLEIHCDETNLASAAIPRRLGYRLDRIEDAPKQAPSDTGRDMVWILERN